MEDQRRIHARELVRVAANRHVSCRTGERGGFGHRTPDRSRVASAPSGSLWRSRGCARGQVRSCSLRRAGGRESTSRPLGGCAAESVRPRKARKEFRAARTPVPKKISTMSRLTHARLPSPATLDQLCLWTLERAPLHTCLGMPLFSVRDGTQGKVSTVIRSRAPLGSLLPPLGPCRFLVPNYYFVIY